VAQFIYLGTTITNQNFIEEEIQRLNSDNAYYHSVKNILSSSLLYKNIKIRIYKTIILHARDIKRRKYTEGVREHDAEEDTWTEEGRSDRRLEKTA
jgi:hypothetical protein